MKNIIIVAHKFLTQPDDELVTYLNEKGCPNVIHVCHSFSDAPDRKSYYRWYKYGKLWKEVHTKDYSNLPEPLIYIKEAYFTFIWSLRWGIRWDMYVGMDGLCVLFGLIQRLIGRARKVIFWAMDFVPEARFKEGIKNKIYHQVNIFGYKKADEMWDLSPRMAEARKKYLDIPMRAYKSRKVVPYGVRSERIKKVPFNQCEKTTIVFMGHLIEKQGVQLVINALPTLIARIPDIKFKIIGGGIYGNELKALAEHKNVMSHCEFLGKIDDIQEVERQIASSAIAIAPYIKELDTWTCFADPGKVKTYLACGVPVILTDLPWNAKLIEEASCGVVMEENIEDMKEKILFLLIPSVNEEYRTNAVRFARSFDYSVTFSEIFKTINNLEKYGQYRNDLFNKIGFPFEKGKSLLDVGCGDGADAVIFKDAYGLYVTGLDLYKHDAIGGRGINFVNGSVNELPFQDDSFDYIFLHDVLHHIDEKDQSEVAHKAGLEELKRVVKKGGSIIIVEGNRYNPLFYPHMVLWEKHEHFTQSYFVKIIKDVFPNAEFKFFESHVYPKKYIKFWKVYEYVMEKFSPKQFLAYNLAVIKKK